MKRFDIADTPVPGVKRVVRRQRGDARGFFARLFCADELREAGWYAPVAQVNYTYTAHKGTVRGLHFQHPPHAEMKLVCCVRGKVWDVAVDLRHGSSTFLSWHAEILSADNGTALLIPEGCAHGFQALCDDVELLYCHSAAYSGQAEGGLHPLDPRLALTWPFPVAELSERDDGHPFVGQKFPGVVL